MWICLPGSHITASLQYQQSVIKTGRRVWSAAWDCFWRIWGWSSRTIWTMGRWLYLDNMCHGHSIAQFVSIKRDGHPQIPYGHIMSHSSAIFVGEISMPQGCSMLAPQRALHVEPELHVPRCNGGGSIKTWRCCFSFTMDLYGINPFTLLLKCWSIFIIKGFAKFYFAKLPPNIKFKTSMNKTIFYFKSS